MGYDHNYEIIFDDEIIEQSVHNQTNAATTSKSRTRRLLEIIAQFLNPNYDGPRIYRQYKRNDPNPPYATKEIHNIWQWANTTDKHTHTKQLIIACGLGAGLTVKETGHLTGADIEIDDLGVQLHLPDNRYILCPQ